LPLWREENKGSQGALKDSICDLPRPTNPQ